MKHLAFSAALLAFGITAQGQSFTPEGLAEITADPLKWYKSTSAFKQKLAGQIYAEMAGLRTREQEPDMSKYGALPEGIALATQSDKHSVFAHVALVALCRDYRKEKRQIAEPKSFRDIDFKNKYVMNSSKMAAQATEEMIDYFENHLEEPMKTAICDSNKHFWVECFNVDYGILGGFELKKTYGPKNANWIDELKTKHEKYEKFIAENPEFQPEDIPEDSYPQYSSFPHIPAGDPTRYVFFEASRGYCEVFYPLVYVR